MKRVHFIFTLFLFLALGISAVHAEKIFTLKDGSQVKGTLVGIDNGEYTIQSTYGTMSVKESDVLSMAAPGQAPASANSYQPQIQAMQQQIMANPDIMADIEALASDPEIMQMITDPELMNAAMSGDVNSVQGNSNALQLMQNPKMQQIMQKIQAQQGTGY